jgi:hypothetical protein
MISEFGEYKILNGVVKTKCFGSHGKSWWEKIGDEKTVLLDCKGLKKLEYANGDWYYKTKDHHIYIYKSKRGFPVFAHKFAYKKLRKFDRASAEISGPLIIDLGKKKHVLICSSITSFQLDGPIKGVDWYAGNGGYLYICISTTSTLFYPLMDAKIPNDYDMDCKADLVFNDDIKREKFSVVTLNKLF